MVNGKNYLNSLLIFLFFITTSPVFPAEFGYTPIGDFPIESVTSSSFVDGSTVALAAAVALGGSALFWGRHEISKAAQEQCATLEKNATDMLEENMKINGQDANKMPWTPPFLIKYCIIKTKQRLIAPLCGSIVDYLSYNRYHLPAAAIFYALGHYFKSPGMGGGFGGATLFAGYMGLGAKKNHEENMGRHTETQKQVAEVKKEVVKQGEELGVKIDASKQAVIDTVNKETAALSKEIAAVETSITALGSQVGGDVEKVALEVKALGSNVAVQLKGVGTEVGVVVGEVKKLNDKLEPIPGQFLELGKKLDQISDENSEKNKQMIAAIARLDQARSEFVVAKSKVDLSVNNLTQRVENLLSTTTEQLNTVQSTIKQNHEVTEAKTKALSDDVQKITAAVAELHQIQASNGKELEALKATIVNMTEMVEASSTKNAQATKSALEMGTAYAESVDKFTACMNTCDERHKELKTSMQGLCDAMEEQKKRMDTLENNTAAMGQQMKENHTAVVETIELKNAEIAKKIEEGNTQLKREFNGEISLQFSLLKILLEETKQENENLRLELRAHAEESKKHVEQMLELKKKLENAASKSDIKVATDSCNQELSVLGKKTDAISQKTDEIHSILSTGSFSSPRVAAISFGSNRKSLPFGTFQDDNSYPVEEGSYSPAFEQIISRKRQQVEAPKVTSSLPFGKKSSSKLAQSIFPADSQDINQRH